MRLMKDLIFMARVTQSSTGRYKLPVPVPWTLCHCVPCPCATGEGHTVPLLSPAVPLPCPALQGSPPFPAVCGWDVGEGGRSAVCIKHPSKQANSYRNT